MSAFAISGLAVAMRHLSSAIGKLEVYCDVHDPKSPALSNAYADLLQAKGNLAAVMQLLEMQADLEGAPTERPTKLRVVK